MASKQQEMWRDILNSAWWDGTLQDWESGNAAALYEQQNKDRGDWLAALPEEVRKVIDSPVAGTSYYKKAGVDLANATSNLEKQLQVLQNAGVNYGNKARSAEQHISALAADLARYGVEDLNDIKAYAVTNPTQKNRTQQVFYNIKTGAVIPADFGSNMGGKGGTYYSLANVNGRAIPVAEWTDTSEAGDLLPAVSLLAAPLTAGLASAIGGALGVSSALGTAAINAAASGVVTGALSDLSGGSFAKGFAAGAVGSAIGDAVGLIDPGGVKEATAAIKTAKDTGVAVTSQMTSNLAVGKAINSGLSGGLAAGAGAAITGGDIGNAILGGGVGGAIGGYASTYLGKEVGGAIGKVAGSAVKTFSNPGTGSGGTGAQPADSSQKDSESPTSARGFGTGSLQGGGSRSGLLARRGIIRA